MPLVSVLLAVHDDARYLPLAIRSVLHQTSQDLELIVIDDASIDETPSILARIADPRLVVLTNDSQLGLAASLNRALDAARGRYVARLDADDVAMPERLGRQLARMRQEPAVAAVGTAVVDVDAAGRLGQVHVMPAGAAAVRWHSLFAAPLIHPTLLVERAVLERSGLRYDPSYVETEDYDLLSRLLAIADGDNMREPLVLKRVHAGQASERRRGLQRSLQRQVALREIGRAAPKLSPEEAELAWNIGSGHARASRAAAGAFLKLLASFEATYGVDRAVRAAAARMLARAGMRRQALQLTPSLPLSVVVARAGRARATREAGRQATAWLKALSSDTIRVAVVSPEPTPYRAPMFDRIAGRPEVDLTVIYASRTVAGRTWKVEPRHRAVFLEGWRLPGVRRIFRHDYPVTPGIHAALRDADPEVVVVSGWSTFASQAAIGWCRAKAVPYILLVESHDLGPRPGWRRAIKGAVVPRLLQRAAGVLAIGSLARDSVVARGARPERVGVFANTVDVDAWTGRATRLAGRRRELRERLGTGEQEVVVLSVGRLAREKGLDTLVRAAAAVEAEPLALLVAGEGLERAALERLAGELGVRLRLLGDLDEERLAEAYVAADVFALLSTHEPWGVVANEAAASGLPLVLSDQVGAAYDLLRDGENGFLVPAGDARAAASALRRLADDPELRERAGARSRELVRDWGYEPSVEAFLSVVRSAVVYKERGTRG